MPTRRICQGCRGQRQRAALAQALAKSPAALFVDEPTANLDPRTASEVRGGDRVALPGRHGLCRRQSPRRPICAVGGTPAVGERRPARRRPVSPLRDDNGDRRMNGRAIVVREARRNLARNAGAAISVVVASALGAGLVGIAVEWFVVVGQARTATAGSFAVLGIATQLGARLPLLVGAVVAAEVIALSTTTLAMRRRRLGEAGFFELTLGAPRPIRGRRPRSRAKVCSAAWSPPLSRSSPPRVSPAQSARPSAWSAPIPRSERWVTSRARPSTPSTSTASS
jgi:hypothetical protein